MDSYYEQGDIFPIERKSAVLPSGVVVEMVEFEEDFLVRAYEVDADGIESKVIGLVRLGTIGGAETMFDSYCKRH